MRTPAFVADARYAHARYPSAFVASPQHLSVRSVTRPSGQALLDPTLIRYCDQDPHGNPVYFSTSTTKVPIPSGAVGCDQRGNPVDPAGNILATNMEATSAACANNTYHGVQFRNSIDSCVDVRNSLTGALFNQYGYPIDQFGNPQLGSQLASWAHLGLEANQAWIQPDTGVLLDQNGNPIPGYTADANGVVTAVAQATDQSAGGSSQVSLSGASPLSFNTAQSSDFSSTDPTPYVIGAVALIAAIGGILLFAQPAPQPRVVANPRKRRSW